MMLNGITHGAHLTVSNGFPSRPYINMSNASAGMVRYNGNTSNLEVYDGSSWMTVSNATPHIDLTETARETINWAYEKMSQERKLKELMNRHPGLKELHDKFEMLKLLCEQEEKENA